MTQKQNKGITRSEEPVVRMSSAEWAALFQREQWASISGRLISVFLLAMLFLSETYALEIFSLGWVVVFFWIVDVDVSRVRREVVEGVLDSFSSVEALRVVEKSNESVFKMFISEPLFRLRRKVLSAEPMIWTLGLLGVFVYGQATKSLEERIATLQGDLASQNEQIQGRAIGELSDIAGKASSRELGQILVSLSANKIESDDLPSFAHADLEGAVLANARFGDIDLTDAILRNAKLVAAQLNGADLSGADAIESEWVAASLIGANLSAIKAYKARWDYAVMKNAVMKKAFLQGASFVGADLEGADFSGADLRNANFSGANLSNADLKDSLLDGAIFEGAITDGIKPVGIKLASNRLPPDLDQL